MRVTLVVAALAMAAGTPASAATLAHAPAPQATSDTLDGIRAAHHMIRNHYGNRFTRGYGIPRGNPRGGSPDLTCDAGAGHLCHGGDPDRGFCPVNASCHRTDEFLAGGLLEEALKHPTSGFLTGQAVYALSKFGYYTDAWQVVEACQAELWWCSALRGYALHSRGRLAEAEAFFREAMDWDDPLARCRWGDAFWLLGEWNQNNKAVAEGEVPPPPDARIATRDWPCLDRLEVSDTLFWWGDPLLSDVVNDRWTEHVARSMTAQFFEEIQEARWGAPVPLRFREWDWATRVRRGPWDSYDLTIGLWTSLETAAYRFMPIVTPDDLSHPVWELEGNTFAEGFTPDYGPFFSLPVQIARFRAGDSLRIAAAAAWAQTELRRVGELSVHLVLSDGPWSFPLRANSDIRRREVPRFLEVAPPKEYMLGIEAMTENGIGWHRSFLSPLPVEGPEISDVLLYDPSEVGEAESFSAAVEAMLGSTTLERGSEVGVFWEVYEVPPGETLEFEMTMERQAGGLVDRITGLFPTDSQEGRGRVTWTEPVSGGTFPRGITLDISNLEPDHYTLVLRVGWEGQEPLERRLQLVVE